MGRSESVLIISKVNRRASRRQLHRLVRWSDVANALACIKVISEAEDRCELRLSRNITIPSHTNHAICLSPKIALAPRESGQP